MELETETHESEGEKLGDAMILLKTKAQGSGVMAQWLRAFVACAEDPCLAPSIHTATPTIC